MNVRKKKHLLTCAVFFLILLGTVFLSGCQKKKRDVIGIAEQYGIAYAPLNIMKELGILEEKLPGVTIEWKQFGGPTAIRESMLNGEVDFGFMGIAPVLIGIDNGMEWKYATGISSNEVAIVTDRPEIKTLKDFSSEDRIAILSPGCTQHVLLCMLADEQLGDARALDHQTVSMTHPDALQALISDTEITAHIATPPYIDKELQAGMSVMATGEEIMGQSFTFISGVAMTKFYEEHPDWYAAFIEALDESIDYINENMEECVQILAPVYGISEEDLMKQMTYNGTIYTNRLEGVEKISAAMQKMGFTSGNPDFDTIIFDNVNRDKE